MAAKFSSSTSLLLNYRNYIISPSITILPELTHSTTTKTTSFSYLSRHITTNTRRIRTPFTSAASSSVAALTSSSSTTTSVSTPSNGYLEYGRLLPCPAESFQPRIEHLVVKEGGSILEFITKSLDLPPLYVADLIHFGAVFYALVCPKPPVTATPEEIKLYTEVTDPAVLSKRPSIKGITVREAQKTFRITHIDEFVEAGTYVRVHVRPKRFPRCYEIDWRSRIIAVTESYVVLNKPACNNRHLSVPTDCTFRLCDDFRGL